MTTIIDALHQFLQGPLLQGQLLQQVEGLLHETASNRFLGLTLPQLQSSGGRATPGAKDAVELEGTSENIKKETDESAKNEEDQAQQYSSLIKAAYDGELEVVRRTLQGKSEATEERSQSGRNALHAASANGHLEIVELLVRANLTINGKDEKGITPLRLAVASNHVQVTRYLLGHKAEPNIADLDYGRTSLHSAALNGHSEIINCLMTSGADVTKQTKRGHTALFLASLNGHAECVKALVEVKEDTSAWDTGKYRDYLDMVDNAGLSALHCASLKGHADIVQTLLQKGASAGKKTTSGMVPLTLAAAEGHLSCVRELLSSTDVDDVSEAITTAVTRGHHIVFRYIMMTTDDDDWSALHNAAWKGDDELLRSLISDGRDINEQTPENECTPLMLAIWHEHRQSAKILTAEAKANVNLSDKSNCSPLHIAVGLQNLDLMRLLLENGAQPDAMDNEGKSPLHDACSKGDISAIKLLLDAGANANIKVSKEDSVAHTPLQFAAMGGHLESVRFLVDKGADIETPGSGGCSALLAAASRNRTEVITFLLTKNANMHVADKNGNSLLFWAALHNNIDLLKKCLSDGGIDINGKNSSGQTALHVASGFGHLEAVKFLLDNQAAINIEDSETCTPLHNAAECNRADVVSFLLDHGADIERKDCDGQTPLHRAASLGCIDSVQTLVQHEADLSAKDEDLSTPLHLAVAEFTGDSEIDELWELGMQFLHGPREKRDNAKCVEYLLDKGAEINSQNDMGYTPFMNAAHKAILDCAKILLSRGADIDVKSHTQSTALHIAAEDGHDEIIQLILEQDPGSEEAKARLEALDELASTPLQNAISYEKVSSVRILCSCEAGLEIPTESGLTPIYRAVAMNWAEIVKLLLSKGVNVNTPAAAYDDETPLHAAVGEGYTDILKMLINNGANLDARTVHNQNVYHMAAMDGKQECLNILIEAARKEETQALPTGEMPPSLVESVDKDGWTPIHFAISGKEIGCIRILCEAGANIEAQSISGETPLQRATETEQADIVEYLLERGADVNKCNNAGMTALHIAALKGLTESLGILLESEADINATTKDGTTPLLMSVRGGHLENVSILLAYGSNVNAQTNTGNAAIHEAAELNKQLILLCLINNGATVDLTTKLGYTAAHFASKKGNTECLRCLLERGADIDKQSNHGSTAILLAAEYCHQECVELLVQFGANISKKDNDGDSLVHVAAVGGRIETLMYVLNFDGMSEFISSKNNLGHLPLHCAAGEGHLACVDLLLALGESQQEWDERGPPVNNQDIQGKTPLHLAVEGGFSPVIEALIGAEADVNIQTNDGKTCLHLAVTLVCTTDKKFQTTDSFEKVSADHPDYETLSDNEKLLLYLLDNGAKCTVFDESGNTPIQYVNNYRTWQLIVSRIPEEGRAELLKELNVKSERIKRTAKKVVGPEGGEIHLNRYDVRVTVPPGALDDDQDITVELLNRLPDPGIQEGEMIASFGFRLSPGGLKFKLPVQIRFPHSAKLANTDLVEMVLYHYKDGQLTKKMLLSGDMQDTPAIVVREEDLELHLSEFCDIFTLFKHYFYGKHISCLISSKPPAKKGQSISLSFMLTDDTLDLMKGKDGTLTNEGYAEIGLLRPRIYMQRNIAALNIEAYTGDKKVKSKSVPESDIYSGAQLRVNMSSISLKPTDELIVKLFHGREDETACNNPTIDGENKGESDQKEAGHLSSENQQTSQHRFDAMIIAASEAISKDSDVRKLGLELGVKSADIDRALATNWATGVKTSTGNLEMLKSWAQTVQESKKITTLRDALNEADLVGVAETCLPSSPADPNNL